MRRGYRANSSAATDLRLMESRFASVCKQCDKPIAKGEVILYSRSAGARHEACAQSDLRGQLAERSYEQYGNDLGYEC